jgi:16S rRNA G527 N7-methylase RsmG
MESHGQRDHADVVAGQVRAILADFLDSVDFQFNRALFLDRVQRLSALIAFWGTRVNLTAAPGDPREIGFHIFDSLAPIIFAEHEQLLKRAFQCGAQLLDLGSGAGFPGLVLASAVPATFTLLESRRKRASFLAVAAAEMGLENVTVERRLPILHQPTSSRSIKPQTSPFLPSHRSQEANKHGSTSAECGRESGEPQSSPANYSAVSRGSLFITRTERGSAFDAVTARAFAAGPRFHTTAAAALKFGGIAILYANPEQNLALADAEKNKLCEFKRIFYEVPRDGRVVQRILGLWRRG